MNAINRLDLLLNQPSSISTSNIINQETSIQPLSRLTLSECDSYPSPILPSVIATTVPLPPRRDSSSMKHHRRRRHQIDQTDKQKQSQPLLNSSTLDDLFRALTLECEQYLAASSSCQSKMIVQPSSTIKTTVESNDEDYENLHLPSIPIKTSYSPLKTSIQVISPIKRHVVSITVSSKMTSPITKTSCTNTKSIICHSSEDDSTNKSSSSTNRKHRRRRTRKQYLSSTTRSSSSSNERKEIPIIDKKPIISKRSCSTDHRYQNHKNSHENTFISSLSSQKQSTTKQRQRRRDVSLQHIPLSNSKPIQDKYSSPLSILLTSDFLDNSHQRQQRRSRLESVNHKSSTLLDRLHQQFYRSSSSTQNKNNNNILTHRIPSYPVY